MDKKSITFIHIFIWLFAIFANLPYNNFSRSISHAQIVIEIFAFLFLMLIFYLFYLILVPYFLDRKKISEFFGFSFLIVLILPYFGYTLLFFIKALFEGSFQNFYRSYSLKVHMSGYFPVLTASVFGSFFRVIINWFSTMSQKSELDKQKLAVELDLLKSKLNPHFLFNTLNNIDSLIHNNPDEASAALIRLSEMMRYLTYDTSSEVVDLNREVEYLHNFIELYRIRTKSPDDIKFEAYGDLKVSISPALFVPLVENAFKFASFRHDKPGVDIRLSSDRGVVDFEISNYFETNSNTSVPGHSGSGIINLKKRLELTYPGKHQMIIDPGKTHYHVKLIIDTNGD
jgi:two-component system, LytTR family, sensor kinase